MNLLGMLTSFFSNSNFVCNIQILFERLLGPKVGVVVLDEFKMAPNSLQIELPSLF